MRALRLEEIGRLAVVDIPEPVAHPGDVIIAVVATGICGSDIHGYTGENGRRIPGQVMGHETVGRIHAIGEGVDASQFPIGAAATVNPLLLTESGLAQFEGREQHDPNKAVLGVDPTKVSAFAERISVPARNVVVLPESIPIEVGALIEPLAVALNSVRRLGIRQGESVLVVGGGPIGQSSILAALHAGASKVYVSELNAERRALCERLGASSIDPAAGPVDEQVRTLHGGPVDAAIDAVGITETVDASLRATALGGRVVLVGMGAPQLELSAYRVSTEERTLIGSFTYSYDVFREAAAWVAGGDEIFRSLISLEVTPDEADATFGRLATTVDIPAKVLVRFDR